MHRKETAEDVVKRFGGDILRSHGMAMEKGFLQHGTCSVYDHSVLVAAMCVKLARGCHIPSDTRALVRGALLHDYFLYDWHKPHPEGRFHAVCHAGRALRNAERDFCLTEIERNMIAAHMFPLSAVLPRYRESVILCAADKICALRETVAGFSHRLRGKPGMASR